MGNAQCCASKSSEGEAGGAIAPAADATDKLVPEADVAKAEATPAATEEAQKDDATAEPASEQVKTDAELAPTEDAAAAVATDAAPAEQAEPEKDTVAASEPAPSAEAAPTEEAPAAEAAAEPEAPAAEAKEGEAPAEGETVPAEEGGEKQKAAEATEKKDTSADAGHKEKKAPSDSPGKAKKVADHSAKKKDEEVVKKKKKPPEEAKAAGPTPEEALRNAASTGDDKTVAKLIKEKVNVNAVDADGKSALMLATEAGEIGWEICSRLTMAKGIKVNLKTTTTKDTALHIACSRNDRECAVNIVRAKADLKATNKAGKTPAQLVTDTELKNWLTGPNPAGTNPPWIGQKMK